MTTEHPCPLCGKPMIKNPEWPGMWKCPDYVAVNTRPPFEFKCKGLEATDEAVEEFEKVCQQVLAEMN